MDVTKKIAEFVAGAGYETVPPKALDTAKAAALERPANRRSLRRGLRDPRQARLRAPRYDARRLARPGDARRPRRGGGLGQALAPRPAAHRDGARHHGRSEEHTSELQSPYVIS